MKNIMYLWAKREHVKKKKNKNAFLAEHSAKGLTSSKIGWFFFRWHFWIIFNDIFRVGICWFQKLYIYMFICKKKPCINSLVPLTSRGRGQGVEALAKCSAEDAFFYVLSEIADIFLLLVLYIVPIKDQLSGPAIYMRRN